ncbi:MAG: ATP synthase F0 subunit B [Acidimicrobiales bacterium]
MSSFDDDTRHEPGIDEGVAADDDDTGLPESLYQPPESEALLRRIADIVATARPMPLSASVMINKEELLVLIEDALDRLPDELRAARWLLKERDEFLANVKREADDILEQARGRAEHMVQRTEVVKAAEQKARQVVQRSRDEARRTKLECDDYVDQKLASFEIVLERTMKTVGAGRSKLQGLVTSSGEVPVVALDEGTEAGGSFFDQDQS